MKDYILLQERDPNISGMSFSVMMQLMPMLEKTKLELHTEMANLSIPIFRDKIVIILMILITVFEDESDQSVRLLKNQLLLLLKRHVKKQTKNNFYVDMKNVSKCIKYLKSMFKIINKVGL